MRCLWMTSLFNLMLFRPEAASGLNYLLGLCLKLNPSGDSAARRNLQSSHFPRVPSCNLSLYKLNSMSVRGIKQGGRECARRLSMLL